MQLALQDKGHYRGKIDGVLGLRTRASIRAYQKAENLPVTGQLDSQTAGKLGFAAEHLQEAGYKTARSKPSAGIKRSKGSGRSGKTGPNAVKTDSHAEVVQEREKKFQARNK
jgi:peptidoglycan hydrolase-like protein with peptidoglycan-binding domain